MTSRTPGCSTTPGERHETSTPGIPSSGTINATLHDNLNFNFIRDIAPVAGIERMPLVMTVDPALPAKTAPESISYAKAHPGAINMGSGGVGSTGHVAGALFISMAASRSPMCRIAARLRR
jgi:tripartite-type tricarboxylate transporter receptor subunit TctC